jgi:MFS family permease
MRLFDPDLDESTTLDAEPTLDSDLPMTESSPGFGSVLRNQRFLVLWGGQVFSQLADKIYLVMMISLITNVFAVSEDRISNWVSAVMIAFTIPAVLFGSLAGVYVDRWSKRQVLVGSNLLRGGLVFAIPVLLWVSRDRALLWGIPMGFIALLVITFLVSTLTQFFAPAEQATIPMIVPRSHLLPANSLYTTTMMALLIVGFAVGEPLLQSCDRAIAALGGSFGRELLVGGAYLLAGLLLIPLNTQEKIGSSRQEYPHVWQDIREGLQYLRRNRRVRQALMQLVLLFCVFAALAVLAVPLAAELPGLKPEQFGAILAVGGVGMGIGAFIVGHGGLRLPQAQLTGLGGLSVALSLAALAAFTQNLVGALAATLSLGIGAAVVGIPMQTTIQSETPEDMRGKVFGLQNNAVNIALSLPLGLAGVAESVWGLSTVLLVLAGLVLVSRLSGWLISRIRMVTSTNVK